MTRHLIVLNAGRSEVRRRGASLLVGVALAALIASSGQAQPSSGARTDSAAEAIPAPTVTPPPVGDSDFDAKRVNLDPTGSVDHTAPAAPAEPAPASPAAPAAPAATQTPAAPAPAVEAAKPTDPVAIALGELLGQQGPTAKLKISQSDRDALKAFYGARTNAPIWLADGKFSSKADAAKARIAAAADDGLDPKRFRLPDAPSSSEPAALAMAEAQMSVTALAYAREAWGGRIDPAIISRNVEYKPTPFDAGAALASFDTTQDVATTLDGFNPQHEQFQALRKLLKEARASAPAAAPHPAIDKPQIPNGRLMTPGDDDPRVPALRERLGLKGDADDLYYDDALAEAVIAFQKERKIGSSGLVNRQTIRALNGEVRNARFEAHVGKPGDVAQIESNMERWRWLPRDLGSKYVFVDLPDYHLHIMQDGKEIYETRVIIGKASNQTPLLSSAINQIVVNPYWNVPVSIALKELSQGSLRGFEVVDSRGRVVSPGSISWEAIKAQKMRIRQPPGARNALGNIKFLFPNRFSVYLHDTSSRKLFVNDDRSLSHGCVRVDKPLEFAEALTGDQGYGGERLGKMIGGKEQGIPLSTTIPVYLTYFTAWVDADGKLTTRQDLYGLDGRVRAALRGETLSPPPADAPIDMPAPRVAKAKPRPAEVAVGPVQQAPVREGPAAWLARLFGDSRY